MNQFIRYSMITLFTVSAIRMVVVSFIKNGTNSISSTYKVALFSLPKKIRPRDPQANTDTFINQHLYFPLIERNEHGQLTSKFLDLDKTRSEDASFSHFRFCLKSDLHFSDGAKIGEQDLLETLKRVHSKRPDTNPIANIKYSSGCVLIDLTGEDPNYFDKLGGIDSTIIKSGTEDSMVPIGYGPYTIEKLQDERISLRAYNEQKVGGFKKIEFVKVDNGVDKVSEQITDWNHLYNTHLPERLTRGYQKIETPMWKVYFMLVRLPKREERIAFAKCFDRERFIKELGLTLVPTSGFLPKGLPGSFLSYSDLLKSESSTESCSGSTPDKSVLYPSYNPMLHDSIVRYFKSLEGKLSYRVLVERRTLEETIKIATGSSPMINLVGSDTAEPTVPGFMDNFVGTHKLVPEVIKNLKEEIEAGARANDFATKEIHFKEAHRLLLDSGYIIPLGELVSTQYYPKEIEGIQYSNIIHGFPQIDRMKIR